MDIVEKNALGYFAVKPGKQPGELAVLVLGCPLGTYFRHDGRGPEGRGRVQIAVAWAEEHVTQVLRTLLRLLAIERLEWKDGDWHLWWQKLPEVAALPRLPALFLAEPGPQEPKGILLKVAAEAVRAEVERGRSIINVPLNKARANDLLIGLMSVLGARIAVPAGDGLFLDAKAGTPS